MHLTQSAILLCVGLSHSIILWMAKTVFQVLCKERLASNYVILLSIASFLLLSQTSSFSLFFLLWLLRMLKFFVLTPVQLAIMINYQTKHIRRMWKQTTHCSNSMPKRKHDNRVDVTTFPTKKIHKLSVFSLSFHLFWLNKEITWRIIISAN